MEASRGFGGMWSEKHVEAARTAAHVSHAVAWSFALLFLSACAGLGSRYYAALEQTDSSLHDARLANTGPPYTVTSTSILGKLDARPPESSLSLAAISVGQYKNWHWIIQGPPEIAISWSEWLSHDGRLEPEAPGELKPAMVLNWKYGFERLWKLSEQLMGKPPIPMSVTLTLVPRRMDYRSVTTLEDDSAARLAAYAWYPAGSNDDPILSDERFHDYARALSTVGGLLEQVELYQGLIPRPEGQAARLMKGQANAACMRAVGLPFLARGTGLHLIIYHPPILAQGMYAEHPDSLLAQSLYSEDSVLEGIYQYLEQEGLEWPATGKDTSGINALLQYRRAFTQYPGDIRTQPMPISRIQAFEPLAR